MASGLVLHVALISESTSVGLDSVALVSAALQKQVARDFSPVWGVNATVDAFPKLEDVPVDYWKMMVMDDIQQQGAAGIHLDDQGQPFALITASANQDEWSLTASHECLEMLADPFGKRLIAGDSPKPDQGRVQFLVEVSDPSEAASFGYSVNGVLVSDFYTPRYFDPVAVSGVQYSFTGAIQAPREVLKGGYLSWVDPVSNNWWQEIWFNTSHPTFRKLGLLSQAKGSFRTQIDAITQGETHAAISPGRRLAAAAGKGASETGESSSARASALRAVIGTLLAESDKGSSPSERRQTEADEPRVQRDKDG